MLHDTVILRVVVKLLLPPILLYALYVQAHGEYGPGGGFQAGVIVAAAMILYALVFGVPEARRVVPFGVVRAMVPLGVLVYGGVGVAGMLLGGHYLDYTLLAATPPDGNHIGVVLVEIGVLITVSGTMLTIFYSFSEKPADGEETD
ncbi:MAG: Na(+)/H(+) antiporter subunit B [Alphaproteobacteria bacterium]|nr:Na(+)/H(+) antiporter subunit B [Alphaproteobacteria bacterium]